MDNSINNFLHKLSLSLQKSKSLENAISRMLNIYKVIPIFGLELEFYLSDNLYDKLNYDIELKVEKGLNQYEIDLPPTPNLLKLIQDINDVKKLNEIYAQVLKANKI